MSAIRTGRCLVCGLRTALHFTPRNVKLNCEDACRVHPRATVCRISLRALLKAVR